MHAGVRDLISKGTWSSASGAVALALGLTAPGCALPTQGGGADSAEIGRYGQLCVRCRRPARAGSGAAEAPPTGDGAAHGTQFSRCHSCGQVRRAPQPQDYDLHTNDWGGSLECHYAGFRAATVP